MAQNKLYDWSVKGPLPELGLHSFAKHQIFDAYITAYIRTLTKSHFIRRLKLTLVDGFCGGGRYAMAGREVDGSPLRMLASVERAQAELGAARARGLEIDAEFVFVDANANHVDFLREVLRERGHGSRIGKDIHIYTSKFEHVSQEIINRIRAKGRAHRSLFFLDQYGWSAVTFQTIRQIMDSLQNPEVILTFMVDHLVNLLNDRMIDTAGLSAIDLSREDVREMLQMKEQRGWKRLIQNTLYEHIKRNTGADYYTPFFIHPEGGSNRDYWLLHLSRHHQAREEMGKIHWQFENTFEHFGGPGFNALGFVPGADVRDGMLDFVFNDTARTRGMQSHVGRYVRYGLFYDRNPGALEGIPFCLDVLSDDYRTLWPHSWEPWCAELEVFHNPFARHPLPTELLPEASHWVEVDGAMDCRNYYETGILWSRSLIMSADDPMPTYETLPAWFEDLARRRAARE